MACRWRSSSARSRISTAPTRITASASPPAWGLAPAICPPRRRRSDVGRDDGLGASELYQDVVPALSRDPRASAVALVATQRPLNPGAVAVGFSSNRHRYGSRLEARTTRLISQPVFLRTGSVAGSIDPP